MRTKAVPPQASSMEKLSSEKVDYYEGFGMSWKSRLLHTGICLLLIPLLSLPASGTSSSMMGPSKTTAVKQGSHDMERTVDASTSSNTVGPLRSVFLAYAGASAESTTILLARDEINPTDGLAPRIGVTAKGESDGSGKSKKLLAVIGLTIIAIAAFFLLSGGGDDAPSTGDLEVSVDVP